MKYKKKEIEYTLVLILLAIFVFVWYRNNHWSVLMGDDLIAVNEFDTLGLKNSLLSSADLAMGKFRPIQKIILWFAYLLCGIKYKKYYLLTRIVLVIISFIIYLLIRKMEIGYIKAVIITFFLITCPFSAYGAWQYIGITESFSLLCCIICGFCSYLLLNEKDEKNTYK